MKTLLTLAIAATLSVPVLAADAAASMDLAKKSGCLACHTVDTKLVGPAWRDVGKKYAGDAAAPAKLAAKVKQGGAGVWGPISRPANATVKDADIKTLVAFMLALK